MLAFLTQRLLQIIPTLIIVSMLIFGLQQLLPGDPAVVLAGEEREELSRLRRENRQLRLEREILSKAAAWFAKESIATPKRSSDS